MPGPDRAVVAALAVALAVCVLAACAHSQVRPVPVAPPPPAAIASAPAPAPTPEPAPAPASAPEPAPPGEPAPDPLVFLPTGADAAISYTGKGLDKTWLWDLVRAAVDARAPGVVFLFGSQCGMVPMRAIDQLDVDLHGLGETSDPGFVAMFDLLPELDPRSIVACIGRQTSGNKRLQSANGIMTVARSPDASPVAFGYTDPARFIAAASPTGSLAALVAALRRGLPLRGSPALADLIKQVAPPSVAWIAITGGTRASDAQAALGIRPVSLVASAGLDSAGALIVAARLHLDSADAAGKVAALIQAQLGALTSRFDELSVGASDADVALRAVLTQAQATALATTLGVSLPSAH